MDEDDRPRPRSAHLRGDAADALSKESLDPYSLAELDARIALLQAEIARVEAHRDKSSAHRALADALFGKPAT